MKFPHTEVRPLLLLAALGLVPATVGANAAGSFDPAPAPTPAPAGSPLCTWTVKGNIEVDHELDELNDAYGDVSPLEGVKVKVSGRVKTLGVWGWWDKWDEVSTDRNGFFEVKKDKSCDGKRRFKVEVKFQNSDVEVRHETATSSPTKVLWFTVHKDETIERTNHTLALNNLVFRAGAHDDLGDDQANDHANAWKVLTALVDKFDEYGSGYAFDKPVKVKVRHNSWVAGDGVESSYANWANQTAYIFRSNDGLIDHLNVPTILHEVMHLWAYQHSSGEADLALNLFSSGSTHCFEPPHIAYHEAFAEVAAERLGRILFGQEVPKPFNRDALTGGLNCEGRTDRITDLDKMEEHEFGWMSALRMLITKNLGTYTFAGTPTTTDRNHESTQIGSARTPASNCSNPTKHSFQDLLSVFLAHSADGYPNDLAKSEMTFDRFLDRAAAILDIADEDKEVLMDLLDPAGSVQPRAAFCDGLEQSINEVRSPTVKRKGIR